MKTPLHHFHRNIAFASGLSDPWAIFRLDTVSYDGMSRSDKIDVFERLASFFYSIGADFHLGRYARRWSVSEYEARASMRPDAAVDPGPWNDMQADQVADLQQTRSSTPWVYLSVRLGDVDGTLAQQVAGLGKTLRSWRETLGLRQAVTLPDGYIRDLLDRERRVFAQVRDYLFADRATTLDLQWVVRHQFAGGLDTEPELDLHWQPRALSFIAPDGTIDDDAEAAAYVASETDVMRLMDSPVVREPDGRGLIVQSEQGDSYQTHLAIGGLPQVGTFPGSSVEIAYAALERIAHPVDFSMTCRWLTNEVARKLATKRKLDAANQAEDEATGSSYGLSTETQKRVPIALQLEDYLDDDAHPPLLLTTMTLHVRAASAERREEVVAELRREYGSIKLWRPRGITQLELFCHGFPAQRARCTHYQDYLTIEQAAAAMPIGASFVGTSTGPCVGHVRNGSRTPVLWDLQEPSRRSLPTSVFVSGTLGAGKTIITQYLGILEWAAGAVVADIDPKGDNLAAEVIQQRYGEDQAQIIEMSADDRWAGQLDPFLIAPPDQQEDAAVTWLTDVLHQMGGNPAGALWETEILAAVQRVLAKCRASGEQATCTMVIDELEAEDNEHAKAAGRALRVRSRSGLARLGFATGSTRRDVHRTARWTTLRIRNLPMPAPETDRSEWGHDERVGQAVLQLLAQLAMTILSERRDGGGTAGIAQKPKLLIVDEFWVIARGTSRGRALIDRIMRFGRSLYCAILLSSQTVLDAEGFENFLGAVFVLGQAYDQEARKALELLQLDADDQRLIQRVKSHREGAGYVRDYDGNVARVQFTPDRRLLAELDTTPGRDTDALPSAIEDAAHAVA